MNIEILPVDSSFPIEPLIEYCLSAEEDKMPAAENMSVTNWENRPNTLLYLIYKEKRFDPAKRARYKVIQVDGKIVASGGYYSSPLSPHICLLSTRTYTVPAARNRMWHAEFLLPRSLEEIRALNYKVGLFVFNEYNLWLRNFIQRIDRGLGVTLGYEHAEVYKGWSSLDHPIQVQFTKQWGLYKMIDPGFENDFLKIMKEIQFEPKP